MSAPRSQRRASAANKSPITTAPRPAQPDVNVAIIAGTLSSSPIERTLPSGDLVVSFEITTRVEGESTRSVPVVWTSPKPSWRSLTAGDRVITTGQIVRRFFRAGGATVSRTEVVAEVVVRETNAARQRVMKRTRARIDS